MDIDKEVVIGYAVYFRTRKSAIDEYSLHHHYNLHQSNEVKTSAWMHACKKLIEPVGEYPEGIYHHR